MTHTINALITTAIMSVSTCHSFTHHIRCSHRSHQPAKAKLNFAANAFSRTKARDRSRAFLAHCFITVANSFYYDSIARQFSKGLKVEYAGQSG